MRIDFSPPDIGEEEIKEVKEALESGWITTGPRTKKLEEKIAEYCETKRAVCLNSATACMEMTLRLLGIGEGDEVITTVYTYSASCSVICHVGATPILIDTKKDSYDMDWEKVEEAVTEKTKAIIAVDLAGIPYAGYQQLYTIAKNKQSMFKPKGKIQEKLGRIAVIADAAHAFGAKVGEKKVGTIADFTCFSFHAVKNLTTAEGGAVTWVLPDEIDEGEIYRQYMLFSLHGQSKDALSKTQLGSWEYDIVAPYYKCNMTDIMAAIGLAQFARYEGMLEKRREMIVQYDEGLKDMPVQVLQHYTKDYQSSGHLYLMRVNGKSREECNAIIGLLAEKEIATNVHYKPLPMLSAYKALGFEISEYPNAYAMFQNEITLPLHTNLSKDKIAYVIEHIRTCIRG